MCREKHMRLGKNKDEQGSTPEKDLEQRVDAMMDVHANDPVPEKVIKPLEIEMPEEDSGDTPPPIDIFKDATTAPEVPKELRKGLAPVKSKKSSDETPAPEPGESPVTEDATDEIPSQDLLDDPKTDKAVDEITREESDKALAAEDAEVAKAFDDKKTPFTQKIKNFFKAWWANKWARYGTIAAILLLIIGSVIWPTSRYFLLNTAGVRSSASIKVTDQSTGLPLKNVSVKLGVLETKTNGDGTAAFKQIKLGSQQLVIDRVAFASVDKKVVVGWGSNPLPGVALKAVGAQYTFMLTDYLSGKPIDGGEIVNGDASAFADKKGKVVLTLDSPESDTIEASIKANDYRTEKVSFAATTKTAFDIKMVLAKPVVYVSKQSGKYDVYKVDVDGKNKQLLLAGTGNERRDGISIATSPDGTQAALVSSRGTKRDANRYLLDTLTLIDTKSGQTKVIDDAARIQLIDWSGSQLAYIATYAAPSAAYAQRQRLVSYNTEQSAQHLLATSDYFNGVASIGGSIYYVVAPSDPKLQPGFYKVRFDGGGKQTILSNKQIGTLVRTNENTFALDTPDGWYEYTIGDATTKKGNPPTDPYASHQYVMAPGSSKSVWVDSRDGKGVLLLHPQKGEDSVITSASGLTIPVTWLNKNIILYRVSNTSETADYVKNIDGGEPKKISDVTATAGLVINY
jgi:hypothetical protein